MVRLVNYLRKPKYNEHISIGIVVNCTGCIPASVEVPLVAWAKRSIPLATFISLLSFPASKSLYKMMLGIDVSPVKEEGVLLTFSRACQKSATVKIPKKIELKTDDHYWVDNGDDSNLTIYVKSAVMEERAMERESPPRKGY